MISIEKVQAFLASGIFELRPTQSKLCFPIIQRIHHKMRLGVEFESIHVKEDLLINGHHRYICSQLLKTTLGINSWSRSSTIIAYKWNEIQVDNNDWESIEIIKRHNRKDAEKSGLSQSLFDI